MKVVKVIIDFVMDILETVVFIGSFFIVVYLFIVQPNQVKGASMEPSFYSNDYILTSKITYKLRPPKRGDVIVFESPKNPDIEYIKRIIALPGDSFMVKNSQVYVNNKLIMENYISASTNLWDGGYLKEGVPIMVPDNYLFVMGDNRPRSSDSREFGPVTIQSIIGLVFYRYYPPNKTGWIKNPLSWLVSYAIS
ncbi:signal peptidase I [Candidatus Roizmanbacteria bacterium CG02_land_8_20_14_3_00_36_15]|uniref:Signal peptidase I n=2 Tax=Candidatus Roizmaniibacteriota TaxID=1752723 RepID=A0A2M8KML2_9BACT|nr:MAG: signal peptidase I [Candidatus Roizmanbacteria bacterium CG03_land_8_20_14_0_80_36_21]PIV37624.1 MAG: signal peptidase I [Candidatus Roizmanbacteria bacterium CG02_land_8_20_14_3_00_36_15]PIY70214.1 MAG: signal peptidase I [Candidatus Roizmanbacteria bacterium CG_4_10_14_0_8_um_filter_36_36]PJA53062.1 MAG: signal peptidase I [Candidatus Roizmanbacteria bacterium CG_4_9_14_3_um_filter_36_11]PJC82098.1 MAG: signal peptidase I [Candidatus Roizmanbacteria bacterium CG_4_8_14_3_um_filter_36_